MSHVTRICLMIILLFITCNERASSATDEPLLATGHKKTSLRRKVLLTALLQKHFKEITPFPPLYQVGTKVQALRNIRNRRKQNDGKPTGTLIWQRNFEIVNGTGHQWCPIVRDNHACYGEHYKNMLKLTTPYNTQRYNLKNFSHGSKIYAEGNSHLLELLYLPICATGNNLYGFQLGKNGNSLFAFLSSKMSNRRFSRVEVDKLSVSILVFDNHDYFAGPMSTTRRNIDFLKRSFSPTHILLGKINGNVERCSYRAKLFKRSFPASRIICRCYDGGSVYSGISDSCTADFQDCKSNVLMEHQCVPSRGVIRGAEELMKEWLGEIDVHDQCL